jgi:hypothetical protein
VFLVVEMISSFIDHKILNPSMIFLRVVGRISPVIDPAGLGGHSHAVRFWLNLVGCEKMSALDRTLHTYGGSGTRQVNGENQLQI